MYTTTFRSNKELVYEVEHKYLDEDLIIAIAHLITQRAKGEVLHTDTIDNDSGNTVYDSSQIIIPAKKVTDE